VMGTNPSDFKGANLPVEMVSWNDVQEFLQKVNARLGSADGRTMVLPTEAQWEYAARAGEISIYSGGPLEQVAWYYDNSGVTPNGRAVPHAVRTKRANAWGLHDMSGNVCEWCADWYDATLAGGVDPKGPSSGWGRVGRGGSWGGDAHYCRAASRENSEPGNTSMVLGFRLARSSVP